MKRFILKISLALLVIIICLLLEVFVRLNPIPIRATFEGEKVLFEDLSINEKISHHQDFELVFPATDGFSIHGDFMEILQSKLKL